jgi:Ca2+-binding EF-hand superfamily protein
LLDKDGDGNISNYEIRSLMNSLGYSLSEEDISTVISKVDTNGKLVEKTTKIKIIDFNR